MQARDAAQCRPDGAAGRDPVIDDDRGAVIDRDAGPVSDIAPPPSLDLGQLAPLLVFDIPSGRPDLTNNLVVQHEVRLAAVDDRADPKLGMTRRTDLAHDQHVERRPQCLRDLEADRHTAARQGQHDRIAVTIAIERLRQPSPGVAPILEQRLEKRHVRRPPLRQDGLRRGPRPDIFGTSGSRDAAPHRACRALRTGGRRPAR